VGKEAGFELVADPFIATFPRLATGGYRIISAATTRYNCIAWAAGRNDRYWWPHPDAFWPTGVPFEVTLQAFEAAYATLGFTRCNNVDIEPGFEKIVIYVDNAGVPKHAARQLPGGVWTSKLGPSQDIEHATADALSGRNYGSPGLALKRAKGLFPTLVRWINRVSLHILPR